MTFSTAVRVALAVPKGDPPADGWATATHWFSMLQTYPEPQSSGL